MKGITYTQVAQYCVLIFAYTVPAEFISLQVTGVALPQLAFGSELANGGGYLLAKLDQIITDLGFPAYTSSSPAAVDSAAAMPPAATRAITQSGSPAISGLASTMMSRSTVSSLPCQPCACASAAKAALASL